MKKVSYICLIVILFFCCGCAADIGPIGAADTTDPVEFTETDDIQLFLYSSSGTSTYDTYTYTVEKSEEGAKICLELNGGYEILEVETDDQILEELKNITIKHQLGEWNGFAGIDEHIQDGSGFSLRIVTSAETAIVARGNNSYPIGFSEASEEIVELFKDIETQYADMIKENTEMFA